MDIVNTVCLVFLPIYIGKCIDCIIGVGNVNFNLLYKNMGIMAVISILDIISIFTSKLCLAHYNYKGTFKIRDLLFEKLQNMPISYIDTTSHGDFISRWIFRRSCNSAFRNHNNYWNTYCNASFKHSTFTFNYNFNSNEYYYFSNNH